MSVLVDGHRTAAEAWVSRMTDAERNAAALQAPDYPVEYRRALFRALAPEWKAAMWREVTARYMRNHPELTPRQTDVLRNAMAAFTAEAYDSRGTGRPAVRSHAGLVKELLGVSAEQELFYTAGPATSSTSRLPIRVRIEVVVKGQVIALASLDCNCNYRWPVDCSANSPMICSQLQGCAFSWFGCGPGWMESCDGYCIPKID